jgi:hypothetical protein
MDYCPGYWRSLADFFFKKNLAQTTRFDEQFFGELHMADEILLFLVERCITAHVIEPSSL